MQNFDTVTKIGTRPGKTLSIIAGIHGNETCGLKAFEEILSNLLIESGTVHFIYGNPEAILKNTRQTEMNLNRVFRPEDTLLEAEKNSYERKRALEIMKYLDQSEALLDIHSSGTEKSVPFIICEPASFPVAEKLPFEIKSCGWDNIHAGSTDNYMNVNGKIGICIECGHHTDDTAIEKAKESILDFLKIFGAISGDLPTTQKQKTIKIRGTYRTKTNFSPVEEYRDFQKISRSELVGFDGDNKITFDSDGYMIFCRHRDSSFEEAFIIGEDAF